MSRFKIGDKVRVREWEDMEEEFGVDMYGDIRSKAGFIKEMRNFCGKIVTISDVNGQLYKIKEDKGAWIWTDDIFENADFCLNDIREEMIVMLRSGEFYVSIGVRFINAEGYIPRCNYCKNMKHKTCNTLFDIVAVYQPSKLYGSGFDGMLTPNSEPIWREKKHIEIPEPDRTILDNLDEKYKWIARDKSGKVWAYNDKPVKVRDIWDNVGDHDDVADMKAFNHLFKFVQWTDEEPVNFREVLKGE